MSFGTPQSNTCTKFEEVTAWMKSSSLNRAAKIVAGTELQRHKRRSKKFLKWNKQEKNVE